MKKFLFAILVLSLCATNNSKSCIVIKCGGKATSSKSPHKRMSKKEVRAIGAEFQTKTGAEYQATAYVYDGNSGKPKMVSMDSENFINLLKLVTEMDSPEISDLELINNLRHSNVLIALPKEVYRSTNQMETFARRKRQLKESLYEIRSITFIPQHSEAIEVIEISDGGRPEKKLVQFPV